MLISKECEIQCETVRGDEAVAPPEDAMGTGALRFMFEGVRVPRQAKYVDKDDMVPYLACLFVIESGLWDEMHSMVLKNISQDYLSCCSAPPEPPAADAAAKGPPPQDPWLKLLGNPEGVSDEPWLSELESQAKAWKEYYDGGWEKATYVVGYPPADVPSWKPGENSRVSRRMTRGTGATCVFLCERRRNRPFVVEA